MNKKNVKTLITSMTVITSVFVRHQYKQTRNFIEQQGQQMTQKFVFITSRDIMHS